jgi:hypothetical protein
MVLTSAYDAELIEKYCALIIKTNYLNILNCLNFKTSKEIFL